VYTQPPSTFAWSCSADASVAITNATAAAKNRVKAPFDLRTLAFLDIETRCDTARRLKIQRPYTWTISSLNRALERFVGPCCRPPAGFPVLLTHGHGVISRAAQIRDQPQLLSDHAPAPSIRP